MKIRYPFKNEQPVPTTDNLVITVSDGDGVAVSGATVSVVPKAETGTVTVTTVDENDDPLANSIVGLFTNYPPQSEEDAIGGGITDENGTTLIYEWDNTTQQPSQTVADVPYDTYILFGVNGQKNYFNDSFVVDGDENVTITLIEPTYDGTVEVGYVNDGSWTPIPNATVEIGDVSGFDTPLFTGTTNSNGVANFNMPYDEYYVRVTATGYTQDGDTYWEFMGSEPTSSITVTRDGD